MARRIVRLAEIQVRPKNAPDAVESRQERQRLIVDMERFLTYNKRYSAKTIANIMPRIHRIINHYGVLEPSLNDAIRIEEKQREKGNSSKTIIHFLDALKLIAEFRGIVLDVRRPKLTARIPDCLSPVEARSLIEAAINKRDRAMMAILLYCGLRNKELCALELDDVDLKNRLIWVRDRGQGIKNRHERKTILTVEAARLLSEWISSRPTVEGNNAVFVTLYGARFRTERVDRQVRDTAKRAGIEKRVFPHLLRHTCATMMLKSGIPITEVALQLGHRSLTSTMVYLHANYEGLKESIDKKFTI